MTKQACATLLPFVFALSTCRIDQSPDNIVTTSPTESLSVAVDNGKVTVTSTAGPTWKATFDQAHGGILWDLRIPSSHKLNIVQQRHGDMFDVGFLNLWVRNAARTGSPRPRIRRQKRG